MQDNNGACVCLIRPHADFQEAMWYRIGPARLALATLIGTGSPGSHLAAPLETL